MPKKNAIESINFQLHKITKNRGHFPDKDAAMKLLYLGLRNISSHRGGYSGTGTYNWTAALNTLARLFSGRNSIVYEYKTWFCQADSSERRNGTNCTLVGWVFFPRLMWPVFSAGAAAGCLSVFAMRFGLRWTWLTGI